MEEELYLSLIIAMLDGYDGAQAPVAKSAVRESPVCILPESVPEDEEISEISLSIPAIPMAKSSLWKWSLYPTYPQRNGVNPFVNRSGKSKNK